MTIMMIRIEWRQDCSESLMTSTEPSGAELGRYVDIGTPRLKSYKSLHSSVNDFFNFHKYFFKTVSELFLFQNKLVIKIPQRGPLR